MPVLELTTMIHAPIERVFDLSRSIDLHVGSQEHHQERAVAGRTSGLICDGECVTWCATHFGVSQTLTTKITAMNAPYHFRDSQKKGIFRRFDHDHFFEFIDGKTAMNDRFDYDSPLGFLGRFADKVFLVQYMTNLLKQRNAMIKSAAESNLWRRFLPESG